VKIPLDYIPGLILMATVHFPRKLVKKTFFATFQSATTHWRHPWKAWYEFWVLLNHTFDSSYLRTIRHRLAFKPASGGMALIRRSDDPDDLLDARSVSWILSTSSHGEVLRIAAENIPTLYDPGSLSLILQDTAALRLHGSYIVSLEQAFNSPDAPPLSEDEPLPPIVHAALFGRAIIHLSVALRSHDDWYWDAYHTLSDTNWLISDDDVNIIVTPSSPAVNEIVLQRILIQSNLNHSPHYNGPLPDIDPSVLPVYIAGAIRILLHRRLYHHLSHYPVKPVDENWQGVSQLETIVFSTLTPSSPPTAISLTAWALVNIPQRFYEAQSLSDMYKLFDRDFLGIWAAYSSEGALFINVCSALDDWADSLTEKSMSPIWPPTSAYASVLRATDTYLAGSVPINLIRDSSLGLLRTLGKLVRASKGQTLDGNINLETEVASLIASILARLQGQYHAHHQHGQETFDKDLASWASDDVLVAISCYLRLELKRRTDTVHGASSSDVSPWLVLYAQNIERLPRSESAADFLNLYQKLGSS